ncbi:MAG: urea carboxylase-associated family protein [Acidobacteria bacterium]|nr:urea carboxylase-associated family protein [Acidobacteriota bacterium]
MKTKEVADLSYNTGRSFQVKQGQVVRVTGTATVDFVAFNLHNLKERFDQARTKTNQGKIFITTGDKLYSKLNAVMMTIVKDGYQGQGTHDLQKGTCSRSRFELVWKLGRWKQTYGYELETKDKLPDHGCWENLSEALRDWEIAPEDVPSPFNLFQTMKISGETGSMEHTTIRPMVPTDVDLRAEMDLLIAVSACPWGGRGQPMRLTILDPDRDLK